MKITAVSVSQGTVSGIAVGDVLQPQPLAGSTGTGTTTLPGTTTGSVTLTVTGHFYNPDNSDSGIVDTESTTVNLQTPSYVQSAYAAPQSPQSTVTVSYLSAQGAGDLNVVLTRRCLRPTRRGGVA
jgi:hypothetical protein